MGEEKKSLVVSIRDFHDNPIKMRFWLKKGCDMIITYRNKPFAYLRPFEESDDAPDDSRTLYNMYELRQNINDFVFGIMDGKEYVLAYYNNKIGVITPDIPAAVTKRLAKDIEAQKRVYPKKQKTN